MTQNRFHLPKDLSSRTAGERQEEAFRYLNERLNYERVVSIPYDDLEGGMTRLRRALSLLGDPDRQMRVIHIAGTKGKGSVASMIERMLRDQGGRTGLFTSPHLFRLEERFVLDGLPVSRDDLTETILDLKARLTSPRGTDFVGGEIGSGAETAAASSKDCSADRLNDPPTADSVTDHPTVCPNDDMAALTFFEITVLAAFHLFAKKGVEFAILETGLGGRLDATNLCHPEVCVITSISYDHQKQLGETLPEIAAEKGGIIKKGVPVVSGVTADLASFPTEADATRFPARFRKTVVTREALRNVENLLRTTADRQNAPFFSVERLDPDVQAIPFRSVGIRQPWNAQIALTVLDVLKKRGLFPSDRRWAVASAASLVLPARGEIISTSPLCLTDGAHNRASAAALAESINRRWPNRCKTLIFAALKEKDVEGMFWELFPHFDRVILTSIPDFSRSFTATELKAVADEILPFFPDGETIRDRIEVIDDIRLRLVDIFGGPLKAAESSDEAPLLCFRPDSSAGKTPSSVPIDSCPLFVDGEVSPQNVSDAFPAGNGESPPESHLYCFTGSFYFAASMFQGVQKGKGTCYIQRSSQNKGSIS